MKQELIAEAVRFQKLAGILTEFESTLKYSISEFSKVTKHKK